MMRINDPYATYDLIMGVNEDLLINRKILAVSSHGSCRHEPLQQQAACNVLMGVTDDVLINRKIP